MYTSGRLCTTGLKSHDLPECHDECMKIMTHTSLPMKMSLGGVAAGRRCSTEKGPGMTYSMSNKQTFLIVI
ncbi:hypothetical protein GcM3_082016b [Golovinomyces cichoracearum]|uniref:Uncharacterized protein n=1 Tax=Golovinomyces cichoracearum TaxID=62708 RepID=A0A420IMV5_9PEZI|nr:hypothetical protein GcM3_082016b [Golovinomyces cichoracearum]